MSYRIFLGDKDLESRGSLAKQIEAAEGLMLCGAEEKLSEILKGVKASGADIAVVDIALDLLRGVPLISDITQHTETRVLVYTGLNEIVYAERCLKAGASGYVMKESTPGAVKGIRRLAEGGCYFSPKMERKLLHLALAKLSKPNGPAFQNLTDREAAVFTHMGYGKSTAEISELLGISKKKVQIAYGGLKKKLKVKSTGNVRQIAIMYESTI